MASKVKEPSKSDIPVEDRCEDFEKIWRRTYYEVLKYWNVVEEKPITDISQLDGYLTD